jgi:DNA-binding MarR family transcriptional regulator
VLLLNELEQLGFATRLRDPHDRRRHLVQLTSAGRKALAQAERAQEAIEDDVLAALTDAERADLHALLTRTLRGIEPADGEAAEDYSATTASIST